MRSKNVEGVSGWSPTGEGEIPSLLDVTLSPATRTVNEGSSAAFTVTVSPAADRELSIPISVTRGTAEADDYSVSGLTNGTLTFADTESSKTFTVSTNTDSDRSDEDRRPGIRRAPRRRRHRQSVDRPTDHQRHHTRAPPQHRRRYPTLAVRVL